MQIASYQHYINRNLDKLYKLVQQDKEMTALVQTTQIDYYAILGVRKQSEIVQICKAYRQIALKNHPSLQHQNKNQAYHRFCQASEAFDVLYDSTDDLILDQKRSIYDKYGQQVLKQGLIQQGSLVGNYKFTVDPEQTFEKFFGSKNVYQHLLNLNKQDNLNHPIFSNPYSDQKAQKKVQNCVVPVECTLTQLFHGCQKSISYQKQILSKDEQSVIRGIQNKIVQISPGACSQNKIVFQGQGNRQPGYPQSDLIFQIKQINQMNFIREGSNLIYTAKISLIDALDSKSIQILQLNRQILQIHFDEIISPQTRRVIAGKGMPIQNKQTRGDLIVKFEIQFPQQLSIGRKKQIVALLKNC